MSGPYRRHEGCFGRPAKNFAVRLQGIIYTMLLGSGF